ncbi:acetyl-CoA synthetase-like protein [Calocera viscosa TUFC12733]|uniref:Acetyl-CoA synthetase-like protein n=1 Tax=Calocera viscosa (strain TUFC12733) TaxID=1330018 RepID=A0A167JSG2_CALVF|nr:acetyl-CoA synthetase-like protein [Calocera viscosa TUFC12733]
MATSQTAGDCRATAATSTTFVVPPLDNSLVFPHWLDHHLENNPDHPYCVLVGSGDEEDVTITWGEGALLRIVDHGNAEDALLSQTVKLSDEQRKDGVRIAILANSDAITYCTLIFAIVRAGFVPFPLSTRNSVPALKHLIENTSCHYVFGSVPTLGATASALEETTASVLALLPSVELLEVPKYTELYPRLGSHPVKPYDAHEDAACDSPLMFLHSSGSTSFPKPIPLRHGSWLPVCKNMVHGKFQPTGTRWGLMGLPGFHGMGVSLMCGSAAAYGTISLMFKPSKIPAIPSPDKVLEASKRGKADYLFAVPSFCVDWSQDEASVKYLATMKGVIYGGGPLAKETGDQLVKAGVNVVVAYGTTEVGPIFKLGIHRRGTMDWNYGELFPTMRVNLVPEGNNHYKLVVLDCDEHPIAVWNQPDIKGFDTNDLLEQHPTEKNLWKIIGRADDQIMMSNGEKTNPGPMGELKTIMEVRLFTKHCSENIISGNPKVQSCLMFGRGRTQVGIAIQPACRLTVANEEELAKFRNLIWSDIEKANAFAPQHSRIFKEFILVIDAKKEPFVRTPKGTISRNASLQQYIEEIDALYSAAEQPTKAEWAEPPTTWGEAALHSFVVRVVSGVMRGDNMHAAPVDETHDLFEQGCDSLQATYIRAAITSALRQAPRPEGKSDIAATSVPQNLVFNYSTVKRLVAYMARTVAAVAGQPLHEEDDTVAIIEDMQAMVEKYTQDFPVHKPGQRATAGEVVLLTGSTGTLGTYLLEQLLLDDRVERVYAVNRISDKYNLLARQQEAFVDRGVNAKLLDSPKLRLLETDLTSENLGFSNELFEEICVSLTTIIHNAWRLDFNLSLSAFSANVQSTRALVDLALRTQGPTPAQVIITSSIGTLTKWASARPVPETSLADPTLASGSGYSASKWVAERLLLAAAQQRALRATIWRVGQLAGSVQNGAWSTTDWLPLIVKSGERLKILPSLPGRVSWIPTDMAAQSIIDVMHGSVNSPSGTSTYLHLVHPRPVSWDSVLAPIARQLECRLVPFSEWLDALSEAAEDDAEVTRNPAIKLLDFYRSIGEKETETGQDQTKEAMGMPDMETREAEARSETLRNLPCLGEEDALNWMGYWRTRGMFS